MKKLWLYLGGIHFAVTLIACTAIFVAAGTILESLSNSHAFAARFTYGHPLFAALLWGFFLNILISALRRWPFRRSHLGFLITHLGLLMVLSGALYKTYFGVQGTMAVMEGTATQRIFLPDSQSLHLEGPLASLDIPISRQWLGGYKPDLVKEHEKFPGLEVQLLAIHPHSQEQLEFWIKDGRLCLPGVPPIILNGPSYSESVLPGFRDSHRIYARQSDQMAKDLEALWRENSRVLGFYGLGGGEELPEAFLTFDFQVLPDGKADCSIVVQRDRDQIRISLTGEHALENQNLNLPYLAFGRQIYSIESHPCLFFFQDEADREWLFRLDENGALSFTSLDPSAPAPLYVLDKAYRGYSTAAQLLASHPSVQEREHQRQTSLRNTLDLAISQEEVLAPPLELFRKACDEHGSHFPEVFSEFILSWRQCPNWLYPPEKIPPQTAVWEKIDWSLLDPSILKGAQWAAHLLVELEEHIQSGENPQKLLSERHWPLANDLPCYMGAESYEELLEAFLQQVLLVAPHLPEAPADTVAPTTLYCTVLRCFGLGPSTILEPISLPDPIELNCPITVVRTASDPSWQLEENQPMVTLGLRMGGLQEVVQLCYDRYATGFKWPVLGGQYLLRFQPQFQYIPHQLRLRHARQIPYPQSPQIMSYEADVYVKEARNADATEATLSMNHVFETLDGYRFYLANLFPPNPGAVKQAQIVVNQDPLKYYLTYPGGLVMSLGILILFWRRR